MGVKLSQRLFMTAAAVTALSLVGCASEGPVEPKPTTTSQASTSAAPTEAAKPTPTPTPKPESKPVTIPACEELVTQEEVQAQAGGGYMYFPDQSFEGGPLQGVLGPSVTVALEQTIQSSYCLWAIPQSDGYTLILTTELPDKARDTFLAELRASDFAEREVGGSPTFVWETDIRYGARFLWYGFAGNILVTSLAINPDAGIANIALARLKEVNSAS